MKGYWIHVCEETIGTVVVMQAGYVFLGEAEKPEGGGSRSGNARSRGWFSLYSTKAD
jgi:hypothetical protein